MSLKAIFFDAGNTLVFPNLECTLAPLVAHNRFPTFQQLCAAERVAKHQLDALFASDTPEAIDAGYWDVYYAHLLHELGLSDHNLLAELVTGVRTSGNWNRALPGTLEALQRLKSQYTLGIISNSDGHIRELLQEVGLADCFSSFTDSQLVGYEKPHPKIFESALESLGVEPAEAMYVGDIYSIDYLGATRVGMRAVLMDIAGAYEEKSLPRVQSLSELETRLKA